MSKPTKVRDLLGREFEECAKYAYGRLAIGCMTRLRMTKAEAQDVAGEALLVAWGKRHSYRERPGTPFLNWFTVLAWNVARSMGRRRRRQRLAHEIGPEDLELLPDPAVSPEDGSVAEEVRRKRQLVLAELPDDLRLAMHAWLEQKAGRSGTAVARAHGYDSLKEFNVAKKRLCREVERIAQRLGFKVEDLRSDETPAMVAAGGPGGKKEGGE